jgi:hypothetical protein
VITLPASDLQAYCDKRFVDEFPAIVAHVLQQTTPSPFDEEEDDLWPVEEDEEEEDDYPFDDDEDEEEDDDGFFGGGFEDEAGVYSGRKATAAFPHTSLGEY